MAFDGMLAHLLCNEINTTICDAKVDKVFQPDKEVIIISFRAKSNTHKLLLSASAQSARICLTDTTVENPANPPMFCMLMRKFLTGARLKSVNTIGYERVIMFKFECRNDFGEKVIRKIAVEIMGKHSNIIMIDGRDIITDAIKRIDFTASSVRQILPGLRYELPPTQNKYDPINTPVDTLCHAICNCKGVALDVAILQVVQGFSPIICREIAYSVLHGEDKDSTQLTINEQIRLKVILSRTIYGDHVPTLVYDSTTKRPIDFAFIEIHQYGTTITTHCLPSFNELIDNVYSERFRIDLQKSRQDDIMHILTTSYDRISRKLNAQQADLAACAAKDKFKKYGDLISSNIWQLKKGQQICKLDDYYDGGQIDVPLDIMLTPSQNAQKYYKKYRKLSTAEVILKKQIECDLQNLAYIDTVFDELIRAQTVSDIAEIHMELSESGFIHSQKARQHSKKISVSQPMKFISNDGLVILVGKNNMQNDILTLKTADRNYMWLHVKNVPGSHAVIMHDGSLVPNETLMQAAILAATFSKASNSSQVPVDYTLIRYVHKPSGAKPGMVIYTNQHTLFVTPDKSLAEKLKV